MSTLIRFGFLVSDLLLLNLSIRLSYAAVQADIWGQERGNSIYLFIFSNVTWLFLVVVANPYRVSRSWGASKVVRSQLSFLAIHLLVVAFLIFLFRREYQPLQVGILYVFFGGSFLALRLTAFYTTTLFRGRNQSIKRFIIVGEQDLAREVRRYFLVHADLGYRFCGLFSTKNDEYPIAEIREFCDSHHIDEVYCCLPKITHAELRSVIDFGMNALIKVKLVSDHRSFEQRMLALERYDQVPLFDYSTIPLDNPWNRRTKRAFDLVFSALVIVFVLSWMIPVIGLAIRLNSPGPIFFKQRRSGRNNRPFECIKFRTMIVNKEADSRQATENDPRVTRLGAFLRKTSLDEFPQFFNVFEGSMTVVGPRPHPIRLNEKYKPLINKYMIRHYVKPGVTGLAQVLGYRGETRLVRDMRNRITLDRFYIENWTFYFDIKIIFMTIVSVIGGDEKAY